MLKALVFSLAVVLALAKSNSGADHQSASSEDSSSQERHGWCPDVVASSCVNGTNGTAANCTLPTSAPACSNVTAANCSVDATCVHPQKCCQTSCGMRCMDLIPYKACKSDADCVGERKKFCKEGTCSLDTCAKSDPGKKGKGGKH